ncbi:MAG: prepilin peptidase [Gemmatimonadota bacterium]
MIGWAWVVAAPLGAALGSFLNVCVHRWPIDQSVVSPRSSCPVCERSIAWYDNLPVLSWLLLRGRCRGCAEPISVQYPLVELAVAGIWGGVVAWSGPSVEAVRIAVFLTILLGIALTDARHYIIPDEFSMGGLAIGLGFAAIPGDTPLTTALLGAAVGFGLLWAMAVLGERAFKKPAMGGGDIKMMAMVGAFLGTPGVFLTVFLGALLGALIFGPISMKTGKLVPFGIFLALGAAVAALWGPAVIEWYVGAFL